MSKAHTAHAPGVKAQSQKKDVTWARLLFLPTAPAHMGHEEAPSSGGRTQLAAATPQGMGMGTKTHPSVCHSPQHCVTTAGTGGTAHSAFQAPLSCWALCHLVPSCAISPIFVPSNLPCHNGNKHLLWQQPLPSTFHPVVPSDRLSHLEQ